MLTLNQAAKEAGKSKSVLLSAMRGGRLSATKGDGGQWQIDPAELFRVYPQASGLPGRLPQGGTEANPPSTMPPTTTEAEFLREKVGLMERIIRSVEAERDGLKADRTRLISVIEEQARTVKQLTHQPTPKDKATYWWWFWAAVVLTIITLAAAPLFWPVLRQASVIYGHGEKTPQAQPVKPNEAPLPSRQAPATLNDGSPTITGGESVIYGWTGFRPLSDSWPVVRRKDAGIV